MQKEVAIKQYIALQQFRSASSVDEHSCDAVLPGTVWNCTDIHSFIYFAFCKSVQGHKQPRGYRTCPITNTINIPYK